MDDLRRTAAPSHGKPVLMDVGPAETEKTIGRLGLNKVVGIDDLAAEVLQAGGSPAAVLYSSLNIMVASTFQWPIMWTGGLLPNIFKGKGDVRICHNHCGILLADHVGKTLTGMVKDALKLAVEQPLPVNQCVGVAKRGTDFATHMIVTCASIAQMLRMSIFTLYVDLTKAYDSVIRQIVMGWRETPDEQQIPLLTSFGVSGHAAQWMYRYIEENGPLWERWQANYTAVNMARTLHENAWFRFPESDRCVSSVTGGPQGCKLGSDAFNSAYTQALDLLRWRLCEIGIAFRLRPPTEQFWTLETDEEAEDQFIVDVVYVDDEALVLLSKSPQALGVAMECLLDILTSVFSSLHLGINWSKDKTEGTMALRGHHGVKVREKWRLANGSLGIPFPNSDKVLFVVEEYKHLGTYISVHGRTFRKMTHRP